MSAMIASPCRFIISFRRLVFSCYRSCHDSSMTRNWNHRNGTIKTSFESRWYHSCDQSSSAISPSFKVSSSGFEEFDDADGLLEEDDNSHDDDYESHLTPWKDLLEIPGRAAWRVSDPHPPQPLLDAMHRILDDSDRTPKQLRRAHRKVLAMHGNLADFRERERRKMVNSNRTRASSNDPSPNATSSRLPGGFNAHYEGDDFTNPVYYGFDETLATLKQRLIPNYSITKRVLAECQSLLGGPILSTWQPKRIVDFGIGCGSASAAAMDLFRDGSGQTTVEWIHGIEPSVPMRDCARRLLEDIERNRGSVGTVPPRITFGNSLSMASESSVDTSPMHGGTFDLALLTYTAAELTDVTSCLAAAALLFEKLKPDGIFVMVEPGNPDGFNSVRAVRNMLLDCCPPDDPDFEWDERCQVLAPCTHNGTCPMERHKKSFVRQRGKLGHDLPQDLDESHVSMGKDNENNNADLLDQDFVELSSETIRQDSLSETEAFHSSFCSFVHHVPGDKSKKGEKFSYVVAQKKKYSQLQDEGGLLAKDPFRKDNLSETLAKSFLAASKEDDDLALDAFHTAQKMRLRYLDSDKDELGLELLRGAYKRSAMGRIIRAPIKKKGHIYVDYCASPGRIIRSRITKAMSSNIAPGVFGAARKSRWGGLWPDIMVDSKKR